MGTVIELIPQNNHMRLRTFESFWLLKNGLLYTYPMLQKNIVTEIVVVGAGITGALISNALMEQGYKVVMLDKRDVGQGSTSATTSMLQYEIDEPLYKLTNKIGEEGAALCYKEGIKAVNALQKLVKKYAIDCGFKKKKSLYLAHNKSAVKNLYKEFELRKKHRLGVSWLSAAQIKKEYGILSHGGILSNTAASVDAYKLAHELIALNVKKGMLVYDQTTIKKIDTAKKNPYLITEEGCKIKCKKIIFCNGFESTLLLKEKVANLIYTYATVSEQNLPLPAKLKDTLVWDTADPYLYLRTTSDGRLLVGGGDDIFKDTILQQNIKEKKAQWLKRKLEKLIPSIDFIEDVSWGGVFGTTKDGLPYIGESPEYNNCLWVLGFGGNGITFSAQGMKIIPDLLKGTKNELSYYYRFGR
jgi:glycine/D-amino acid oxidase-like deaminating enzyme